MRESNASSGHWKVVKKLCDAITQKACGHGLMGSFSIIFVGQFRLQIAQMLALFGTIWDKMAKNYKLQANFVFLGNKIEFCVIFNYFKNIGNWKGFITPIRMLVLLAF